jgi:C-terminal processing protease CtpA/Prc
MGPDAGWGETEADIAAAAFTQVASFLADADGIILDVRYNPGGSDDVALTYAGYFTKSPVPAFTKTTRTETGYTQPFTATIPPQSRNLTAPVVVLTSKFTGSAAEIFTMAMRELPQATTMGEATSGGLSDVLTFALPNGWTLGLSHQVYLTMAGESFESTGIPPDIAIPVDVDAAKDGTDTMLQAAIAHLDAVR